MRSLAFLSIMSQEGYKTHKCKCDKTVKMFYSLPCVANEIPLTLSTSKYQPFHIFLFKKKMLSAWLIENHIMSIGPLSIQQYEYQRYPVCFFRILTWTSEFKPGYQKAITEHENKEHT